MWLGVRVDWESSRLGFAGCAWIFRDEYARSRKERVNLYRSILSVFPGRKKVRRARIIGEGFGTYYTQSCGVANGHADIPILSKRYSVRAEC